MRLNEHHYLVKLSHYTIVDKIIIYTVLEKLLTCVLLRNSSKRLGIDLFFVIAAYKNYSNAYLDELSFWTRDLADRLGYACTTYIRPEHVLLLYLAILL